jgi:hypothetical protein
LLVFSNLALALGEIARYAADPAKVQAEYEAKHGWPSSEAILSPASEGNPMRAEIGRYGQGVR